ncbi:porin family protein [Marinobacterium jannaschii]|uniref:hypothetical protein n=1 Tax=Marinobacterium jannaschii TaxID=64970 RepID=UPI00068732C0|nr:hypothetical protein [Marinobacterium jannaschii]
MKMQATLISAAIAASIIATPSVEAGASEIDMLRAEIQRLTNRVNQLESQSIRTEQQAAEAESKAEQAMATADHKVSSGNDKIRVSVSGHINRALMVADDGQESDFYHVDNDSSSTRIRFLGEGDVSPNFTVGTAFEAEFESNSTATVNQNAKSDVNSPDFKERRLEFYFDHTAWGRIWVGQGWTASEDTSEYDLSGTALAGYSSTADIAGGILFRDSAGNLTGDSVGAVFVNMDGLGRADRIRYDTPELAGLQLSASAVEDDAWDLALKYGADYGATKVVGAIAYSDPASSSVDNTVNGSVSVLFGSGLNLTFAAGQQELSGGGDDPSFYYGKLGYITRLSSAGSTAFSIDYHHTEDILTAGDEGKSIGLQAVQNFDDWATEGYIGYRNYELERTTGNVQDVDALIAGARVKF